MPRSLKLAPNSAARPNEIRILRFASRRVSRPPTRIRPLSVPHTRIQARVSINNAGVAAGYTPPQTLRFLMSHVSCSCARLSHTGQNGVDAWIRIIHHHSRAGILLMLGARSSRNCAIGSSASGSLHAPPKSPRFSKLPRLKSNGMTGAHADARPCRDLAQPARQTSG